MQSTLILFIASVLATAIPSLDTCPAAPATCDTNCSTFAPCTLVTDEDTGCPTRRCVMNPRYRCPTLVINCEAMCGMPICFTQKTPEGCLSVICPQDLL
ncbi:hypothetical protein HDV06_000351 [Boothiomyces sp. JEL0866]|nr:hypothetical protein HDV06_000351 [Boothiomyces sp. JEL0866]